MNRPVTVGDVYKLVTTEVNVIDENASKKDVINALLSGSNTANYVYVIDARGRLKGIITVEDILNSVSVRIGYIPRDISLTANKLFELSPFGTAADMMQSPVFLTKETELQVALKEMVDNNLSELPVTDDDGRVIGDLNAFEILKFI